MQPDSHCKLVAIACASRSLNHAKVHYTVTHLESLAIVWALRKLRDLIYGYPTTVYSDYLPVTYLFNDKQLTGRLARRVLTIQEFSPEIRYFPVRVNLVADALSRNIGAVTIDPPVVPNFSLQQLTEAQRTHDVWKAVIYLLESGDETYFPSLPVPFSQFSLSADGILCRF